MLILRQLEIKQHERSRKYLFFMFFTNSFAELLTNLTAELAFLSFFDLGLGLLLRKMPGRVERDQHIHCNTNSMKT